MKTKTGTVLIIPIFLLLIALITVPVALLAQTANGSYKMRGKAGKHRGRFYTGILFGENRLKTLRRASSSTHAELAKALYKKADKNASVPVPSVNMLTDKKRLKYFSKLPAVLAFAYLISENKRYLTAAVRELKVLSKVPVFKGNKPQGIDLSRSTLIIGLSLCYDWLYSDLEPALKKALQRRIADGAAQIVRSVQQNIWWKNAYTQNHNQYAYTALYFAVVVLTDYPGFSEKEREKARELVHENYRAVFALRALQKDGSDHEGPSYTAYGLHPLILYLAARERQEGIKPPRSHPWLFDILRFQEALLGPDGIMPVMFGDSIPGYFAGPNHIWYYLDRINGGSAGHRLARRLADRRKRAGYSLSEAEGGDEVMLSYLFYDGREAALGPVPESDGLYVFKDYGAAFYRGGNAGNEPFLAFKSGAPGGKAAYFLTLNDDPRAGRLNIGHDHPDANHFSLRLDGNLIFTDTGYQKPKQTSGHNTILLNGKGQVGEGREWFGNSEMKIRDAGGRLVRAQRWKGGILIAGDAENTYPRDLGLKKFRRTLWMRKDGALFGVDWIDISKTALITHNFNTFFADVKLTAEGALITAKCSSVRYRNITPCPFGKEAEYKFGWPRTGSEFKIEDSLAVRGELKVKRLIVNTRLKAGNFIFPFYILGGANPERQAAGRITVRREGDSAVFLDDEGIIVRLNTV